MWREINTYIIGVAKYKENLSINQILVTKRNLFSINKTFKVGVNGTVFFINKIFIICKFISTYRLSN